jgi:hypothetical protein
VFSVSAKVKDDEVHPTLRMIGLYLNTLAQNGVPAKRRHLAAMFHQGGGDAVFANEVWSRWRSAPSQVGAMTRSFDLSRFHAQRAGAA